MGFSELRNVSLSVHYRIWSILRQQGWFFTEFGVPLEQHDPDVNPLVYTYNGTEKPLVFMDNQWAPWPSGVRVYDAGNPLPSGAYSVDYLHRLFTLVAAPSGDVTADLTISSVNVREGYPEGEELQKADLPIIAYEVETDENSPFGLGTAQKWRMRYVTIDILATNDGERKDLTDNINRYIGKLPYLDFSEHAPLNENNNLDLAFNFADQWDGDLHIPQGVRGDLMKPKQEGSEKERYRSLIAFECETVS